MDKEFAALIEAFGEKQAEEVRKSGDYSFFEGRSLEEIVCDMVANGSFGGIVKNRPYIEDEEMEECIESLECQGYKETSLGVLSFV